MISKHFSQSHFSAAYATVREGRWFLGWFQVFNLNNLNR